MMSPDVGTCSGCSVLFAAAVFLGAFGLAGAFVFTAFGDLTFVASAFEPDAASFLSLVAAGIVVIRC